MKITVLVFAILSISFSVLAQSDLNKIILNKEGIVDKNWVEEIQKGSEWEYIKTVGVKGKKISSVVSNMVRKTWSFSESSVKILPYMWKSSVGEYSDLDAKFHSTNQTIVIEALMDLGKGRTSMMIAIYEVINLTEEYLILEEIEDRYCFDYIDGRRLSKKECKEKVKKEPKIEQLFGGTAINIGGKPPKKRMVFKRIN